MSWITIKMWRIKEQEEIVAYVDWKGLKVWTNGQNVNINIIGQCRQNLILLMVILNLVKLYIHLVFLRLLHIDSTGSAFESNCPRIKKQKVEGILSSNINILWPFQWNDEMKNRRWQIWPEIKTVEKSVKNK